MDFGTNTIKTDITIETDTNRDVSDELYTYNTKGGRVKKDQAKVNEFAAHRLTDVLGNVRKDSIEHVLGEIVKVRTNKELNEGIVTEGRDLVQVTSQGRTFMVEVNDALRTHYTPPRIMALVREEIKKRVFTTSFRFDAVIDATAGTGMDAIAFADLRVKVFAVEKDEANFNLMFKNVAQVQDVVPIHSSILQKEIKTKNPANSLIYIDFPWGGDDYEKHMDEINLDGLSVIQVLNKYLSYWRLIKLPAKYPKRKLMQGGSWPSLDYMFQSEKILFLLYRPYVNNIPTVAPSLFKFTNSVNVILPMNDEANVSLQVEKVKSVIVIRRFSQSMELNPGGNILVFQYPFSIKLSDVTYLHAENALEWSINSAVNADNKVLPVLSYPVIIPIGADYTERMQSKRKLESLVASNSESMDLDSSTKSVNIN